MGSYCEDGVLPTDDTWPPMEGGKSPQPDSGSGKTREDYPYVSQLIMYSYTSRGGIYWVVHPRRPSDVPRSKAMYNPIHPDLW